MFWAPLLCSCVHPAVSPPSYPMFPWLPTAPAGGGNPSIRAGFSPRRTSIRRERGWFLPDALTHRGSALKATEEIRTKSKILFPPPLRSNHPLTMFRVLQENTTTIVSTPRLGLQPAPRCCSSSSFRSAPSWTDRCQFHQRGDGAAHPGRTGCQTPIH